jgi:hypothetical protein
MEDEQFPAVDEGLVQALIERFPDRCPRGPVENFELGKLVGQQEVIAFLRSEMELQTLKRSQ